MSTREDDGKCRGAQGGGAAFDGGVDIWWGAVAGGVATESRSRCESTVRATMTMTKGIARMGRQVQENSEQKKKASPSYSRRVRAGHGRDCTDVSPRS
jgi:hypothetical protein